ncbi:Fur family transcriptional regulator, partial [Kineococcus glutinatus]|uniref:Fur family transcriptional regulator n=1 Tax=Kineococcus glutinatus TaxID=1070872 RepID=UPI0031EF41ED
ARAAARPRPGAGAGETYPGPVEGGSGLARALRERGLRRTAQRELVLQAVADLGHATCEEVAEHVQRQVPDVNLSTVYRALDVLVEVGLVARGHLDRQATSYHLLEHADHLHVVCEGCSAMGEVPAGEAATLVARVSELSGYAVDARHLVLRGRCPRCRQGGAPGGAAAGDHDATGGERHDG